MARAAYFHLLLHFYCLIYALKLAKCCWGNPAVSLGAMYNDVDLNVGESYNASCLLYNDKLEGTPINCSNLEITFNNKVYPSTCLNSTVAQIEIENGSEANSGNYYCYLNFNGDKRLVCLAGINFGYKPLPVKDFKCYIFNMERINCSWTPPDNKVPTKYTLKDLMFSTGTVNGPERDCPATGTSKNSCEWRRDTDPIYRSNLETLTYVLTGNNSLGIYRKTYKVFRNEIIIPGMPRMFRKTKSNSSCVELAWERHFFMDSFRGSLIYQVQYKSDFDQSWQAVEIEKEILGTVCNLYANTVYELRLRYKSAVAKGENMWSDFRYTTAATEPDFPIAPITSPQAFEVKDVDNVRSVTLYWKMVDKRFYRGQNFTYEITYSPTYLRRTQRSSSEMKIVANISGAFNRHTIGSLDAQTAYEFTITSRNEMGKSKNYSSISVDKTQQLPSNPYGLTVLSDVQSEEENVYSFDWHYKGEANLTDFTLFWCENINPRPFNCHGMLHYKSVPKSDRPYTLTLDNKAYQFAISANFERTSSGMEWFSCIVPKGRALDRIKEFSVETKSAHTMKVVWNLDCSAQNHVVLDYVFSVCNSSSGCNSRRCQNPLNITVRNEHKNVTSHLIHNLDPYHYYGVRISAINLNGLKNEWSDMKCIQTFSDAPLAPIIPENSLTSIGNTISLSWSPPKKANGVITSYIIHYNNKNVIWNITEAYRSLSAKLSHQLTNLSYYTDYSISVQACVSNLCSENSNMADIRTGISAPGVMEPPRAEVLNSTNVRLTWRPPQPPNGPLDFYLLHLYQMEGNNETHLEEELVFGNQTSFTMTLNCGEEIASSLKIFRIQAVNLNQADEELKGNKSEPTEARLCYENGDGQALALVIGGTVGGTLGLAILVFVLYMVVNWNKKRVDAMKKFEVKLPPALDSPYSNPLTSYANFKNGTIERGSSPKPTYDRMDSNTSEEGFKNRHGSGTSQYSANSTDELIAKQNKLNEKNARNPSGDSGGHDSLSSSLTHRTNLSSDSGNEADLNNPPSPDIVREEPSTSPLDTDPKTTSNYPSSESRVSSSKDSGLDKGDSEWDFSKGKPLALNPYTKIGTVAPPYSKIGLAQSCYVPFSRGSRNMALFGHNMANSEPNIPELQADVLHHHLDDDTDPTLPLSPSNLIREENNPLAVLPYSKFGISRSIQNVNDMLDYNNQQPGQNSPLLNTNPSLNGHARPANLNLNIDDLAVLPYSRFGMRRLPSPTSKNNPYVTVGMTYMLSPGPDPNSLFQHKKDPLAFLKQTTKENGLKNMKKQPPNTVAATASTSNGYVPIDKLNAVVKKAIVAEAKENQLPNAYSKLGLGNPGVTGHDVSAVEGLPSPAQSPQSKPSSSGYVSLDDVKIIAKSSAEGSPVTPLERINDIENSVNAMGAVGKMPNLDDSGYLVLRMPESPVKEVNNDKQKAIIDSAPKNPSILKNPNNPNGYVSHDEVMAKMNPKREHTKVDVEPRNAIKALNGTSPNKDRSAGAVQSVDTSFLPPVKRSNGYITIDRLNAMNPNEYEA